jgi:Asp-tRNA(Asn)/Glu-tRNA(Gln) amidotransferase A subunit family amidase
MGSDPIHVRAGSDPSEPQAVSYTDGTMRPVPLHYLAATNMARLVREGALSPVELVDAHPDRIATCDPTLRAYVRVDADRARREAAEAAAAVRRGDPLGPLHGVPISIKSAIAVEGLPWETGTRLRAGIVGERDATLVRRLRRAGAIVLGVTNVAEQLMAWETDNALYGRTNSPWDLDRTPGGSSGGESAAIAAGLSAGGVGSDGGGSIRVPAHFTGICGLKPTPGRVPATGHFPPCGGPFALTGVVGPMARTVDDTWLLLSVMAGSDDGDPNGHPVPLGNIDDVEPSSFTPVASLARLGGGAPARRRLRIGWFEDDGRTPVADDCRRAVGTSAGALAEAGFDVIPFRPEGLEEARTLWWEVFGRASRLLLEPVVDGHEATTHPNLLQFLEWTRQSPRLTAERLLEVEIARDVLRARMLEQMQDVPVLLCPVAAVTAFRHGEREWEIDGRRVHYLDAWSYAAWFNLLQNPAVSVPVGRSATGLPVGVQVVAPPWQEHLALAVARVIESCVGGFVAPPALGVGIISRKLHTRGARDVAVSAEIIPTPLAEGP